MSKHRLGMTCEEIESVLTGVFEEREAYQAHIQTLEEERLTEAEARWALWALGQTGQMPPKPLPTKAVVNAAFRKLRSLAGEVTK